MKAEDYIQRPERTDVTVSVELDTKARALYGKFEKEMFLQIDEESLDAGTAAVLSNKLLQMCNGAVYGDSGTVEIHDCKIEAFMELVEAAQG